MKRDDRDTLRDILRRGDPAADGSEPSAAELAGMRERIRTSRPAEIGPESEPWHRSPRRTLTVAAVAALLVLALGTEIWLRRAAVETGPPATPTSLPGEPAASGQQVHFTTPGGTRIVWVLYPAREIVDTDRGRGRRGPGGSP